MIVFRYDCSRNVAIIKQNTVRYPHGIKESSLSSGQSIEARDGSFPQICRKCRSSVENKRHSHHFQAEQYKRTNDAYFLLVYGSVYAKSFRSFKFRPLDIHSTGSCTQLYTLYPIWLTNT
ncbi:hypothetical protein GQX74_013937 [Glossina fuscipes]|nr:hypothetical protein GQX74_013937 [Glossina fuscipes]